MTNERLDGSGTVPAEFLKIVKAYRATRGWQEGADLDAAIAEIEANAAEPVPAEQPLCDNPRCDGLTHNHGDGLQVVCPVASAEQPPLREVSEGVYTSYIKPHRVDDVRIAEIINRGPVAAATADVRENYRKAHNAFVAEEVEKIGATPAEGPRPEICPTCGTPKKYFENSAAQPSPDAAKVEEIIEAILQEMRTQEFHLPAKFRDKVTAILRRYFPAGQRETK